jgi:uncharacterized Tic20 family protein
MGIAEEIEKLDNLRQGGAISEDEYQQAKESLLEKNRPAGTTFSGAVTDISSDVNMWSMFIHLSQFCGYFFPLAGLVVPIVLWQMKKDESEIIDKHGRIVINWILTEFIYGIVFVLLCVILIGIPLILALIVVSIVFPIVGGVKANNGELWPYPFSIRFFRLD